MSARRGAEAIGVHWDGYSGTAVHDGWKSYWGFGCKHAVCNAHILRELKFLAEERGRFWAALLVGRLRCLLHEVKQAQRQGKNAIDDYPSVRNSIQCLMDAALVLHPPPEKVAGKRGRLKKSKERHLLERLNDHLDEVLAFARDFSVPFDNNQAERDIRVLKVVQKVAGCRRTESGAKRQLTLRSFFSTCQKLGLNLFQVAIDALEGVLPRLAKILVTT